MARQIALKCIENNLAPCDGSMLDADGVLLRCRFLLVYNPLGSGSTILLSLPDQMYSSTPRREKNALQNGEDNDLQVTKAKETK